SSELGLEVWAVDASSAMLARLRSKRGGHRVRAVLDDMAELRSGDLPRDGVGVVLCAFNTLFNLTDTVSQRRCLRRVAELLIPDSRLVLAVFRTPADDPALG